MEGELPHIPGNIHASEVAVTLLYKISKETITSEKLEMSKIPPDINIGYHHGDVVVMWVLFMPCSLTIAGSLHDGRPQPNPARYWLLSYRTRQRCVYTDSRSELVSESHLVVDNCHHLITGCGFFQILVEDKKLFSAQQDK